MAFSKYGFSEGTDANASAVTLGDGTKAPAVAAFTAPKVPIEGESGVQTIEVGTGEAKTLTVPEEATEALIAVDNQSEGSLRYWENGQTPSSTKGIEILPGYALLATEPLSKYKFIAKTKAVTIQVAYRKYGE